MDRYQRFEVCGLRGEKAPVGVFQALSTLDDEGFLQPGLRDALRKSVKWFNRFLRVPPGDVFNCRGEWRQGRCWFKARAGETLSRFWEIAWILKSCDVPVRLIQTEDAGQITYEDDDQVVALPRRSTRWKSRII